MLWAICNSLNAVASYHLRFCHSNHTNYKKLKWHITSKIMEKAPFRSRAISVIRKGRQWRRAQFLQFRIPCTRSKVDQTSSGDNRPQILTFNLESHYKSHLLREKQGQRQQLGERGSATQRRDRFHSLLTYGPFVNAWLLKPLRARKQYCRVPFEATEMC